MPDSSPRPVTPDEVPAALNKDAKAVLRETWVTPAMWARANYSTDGTWSGDACGCPDSRCKDGFHHFPGQECGCLAALLDSYVSGEGQFAGEPGYVIRDPLRAQVRLAARRAGRHSGRQSSALLRASAALDELLALPGKWAEIDDGPGSALTEDRGWVREACAADLRAAISSALLGKETGDG